MAIAIPGADSRNRVGGDVDRLLPVLSQTDNLGTLDLCLGNFHPVFIKVPSLRVTVTGGAIRELPWTLEDMAACAGLSRSAFFKRFNDTCGQSPGQVLLALRMGQACRLLKADQSVVEVAAAVGYQSIAAFTRAFHKATGQQPGAFRRAAN